MRAQQKSAKRDMIRESTGRLRQWIEGLIRDCRVRELSPFTIDYYRAGLINFEVLES